MSMENIQSINTSKIDAKISAKANDANDQEDSLGTEIKLKKENYLTEAWKDYLENSKDNKESLLGGLDFNDVLDYLEQEKKDENQHQDGSKAEADSSVKAIRSQQEKNSDENLENRIKEVRRKIAHGETAREKEERQYDENVEIDEELVRENREKERISKGEKGIEEKKHEIDQTFESLEETQQKLNEKKKKGTKIKKFMGILGIKKEENNQFSEEYEQLEQNFQQAHRIFFLLLA